MFLAAPAREHTAVLYHPGRAIRSTCALQFEARGGGMIAGAGVTRADAPRPHPQIDDASTRSPRDGGCAGPPVLPAPHTPPPPTQPRSESTHMPFDHASEVPSRIVRVFTSDSCCTLLIFPGGGGGPQQLRPAALW